MIVLDTHIWVWWANDSQELRDPYRNALSQHGASGLGVSVISCGEVGKLVEKGRLKLTLPLKDWIETALALPGIVTLPLTAETAIESVQLPRPIHGDPADQLLIATARVLGAPLLTADHRLLEYGGVDTLK